MLTSLSKHLHKVKFLQNKLLAKPYTSAKIQGGQRWKLKMNPAYLVKGRPSLPAKFLFASPLPSQG